MPVTSIDPAVYASWPTPNYVNPVRRTWMPAFLLVWQIASTIMVSGRFYLRARKLAGAFGFDELLIFFGWLFSIGMSTATWIDATHFGLDRHTWDVKREWSVGAAKTGWIAQLLFVCATVCTKLSILLLHRRMIKETVDRRWLWALRAAFAFTSCYGIAVVFGSMFSCRPLNALWLVNGESYTKKYTCISTSDFGIAAGILSVLSDVIAVLLPCLMLHHYDLAISRKQKIVLNATFCLGLIATGAGIARTVYVWRIQHTSDSTWTGHTLCAWSAVETQLSIICACAPSLRAFFRRYLLDTLKRSWSGVSHYADGTKQGSFNSVGYATRDSRGFSELKQLESGVHGVQFPPPVILNEEERGRRSSIQCAFSQTKTQPPSPKCTTPDEYEMYVNDRLSKHGAVIRERQSRTESILVRMDQWVDQSSMRGKGHDRRNNGGDGMRRVETDTRTAT